MCECVCVSMCVPVCLSYLLKRGEVKGTRDPTIKVLPGVLLSSNQPSLSLLLFSPQLSPLSIHVFYLSTLSILACICERAGDVKEGDSHSFLSCRLFLALPFLSHPFLHPLPVYPECSQMCSNSTAVHFNAYYLPSICTSTSFTHQT